MTTAKISATRAEDILGYVPHALGFRPRESLVFLTLHGTRVGATLRVDLPPHSPVLKAAACAEYARAVAGYLAADARATASLAVMYTAEPVLDPRQPPHQALMDCVCRALQAAGMPVKSAWAVSDQYWRDYHCRDAQCCPVPGTPCAAISESRVSAEMIFRGSSYADSFGDAVAARQCSPWPNRPAVAAEVLAVQAGTGPGWLDGQVFAGVLARWNRLISGPAAAVENLPEDPRTAAYLLASLECRAVRDSLIVLAVAGPRAALRGAAGAGLLSLPDAALRSGPGPDPGPEPGTGSGPASVAQPGTGSSGAGGPRGPSPSAADAAVFAAVILGRRDDVPDWRRVDGLDRLARKLLAVADGESRAALLTVLAWVEWARGRGSWSLWYLDRCLAETPEYRLAVLLHRLLLAGSMPEWATSARTSWSAADRRRTRE